MALVRTLAACVTAGYGAFRQHKFEYGFSKMLPLGLVVPNSTFMLSVFTATLTYMTGFRVIY